MILFFLITFISSVYGITCTNVTNGDHKYAFCNVLMTRDNAEAQCVLQGGHLVTISSSTENSWIYNQRISASISMSGEVWSGLKTTDTINWVWASGESGYANWLPGTPNGGTRNPNCARFLTSSLNIDDITCTSTFRFICESIITTTTSTSTNTIPSITSTTSTSNTPSTTTSTSTTPSATTSTSTTPSVTSVTSTTSTSTTTSVTSTISTTPSTTTSTSTTPSITSTTTSTTPSVTSTTSTSTIPLVISTLIISTTTTPILISTLNISPIHQFNITNSSNSTNLANLDNSTNNIPLNIIIPITVGIVIFIGFGIAIIYKRNNRINKTISNTKSVSNPIYTDDLSITSKNSNFAYEIPVPLIQQYETPVSHSQTPQYESPYTTTKPKYYHFTSNINASNYDEATMFCSDSPYKIPFDINESSNTYDIANQITSSKLTETRQNPNPNPNPYYSFGFGTDKTNDSENVIYSIASPMAIDTKTNPSTNNSINNSNLYSVVKKNKSDYIDLDP